MALTRFNATQPPESPYNVKVWAYGQFVEVDRSISDLLATLVNLNGAKIEVGAIDSGGVGYRLLRIPN